MDIYQLLDLTGTFVFAVSGVRVAAEKKMDIFGAMVIGFATAIGGGTLRDVVLGSTPVDWLKNELYLYLIIGAVTFGILFDRFVMKLKHALLIFDSIGLGVFTIYGLEKALNFGLHEGFAVLIGITSATAGGIIRDILANEIPIILKREIYATACLAGALLFLLLKKVGLGFEYNSAITIFIILVIRTVSVRYKFSFPEIKL
jgi:uncharacterized membrane protein YeiH